MLKLIIYDISDDKSRTKLAKHLDRMGAVRIQYSVFSHDIPVAEWSKVEYYLAAYFKKTCNETDSLLIMKIERQHFAQMFFQGRPPDFNYILDLDNTYYL